MLTYEATSSDQLQRAGLPTWVYKDLATQTRLPPLPIAVLYETEPGFGHWTALLPVKGGIEHFDSYGLRPDAELRWVPQQYREAFAATTPHLVRLLLADGRPVAYSEFRLQAGGPIATCGRWVAARVRNRGLDAGQFARGMRDLARALGLTPDEAVVALTGFLGPAPS